MMTSSGAATTTNASDLLVGSNQTSTGSTGLTLRIITGFNGDILEDEIVSATNTYTATAPTSPSGTWIMKLAASIPRLRAKPEHFLQLSRTRHRCGGQSEWLFSDVDVYHPRFEPRLQLSALLRQTTEEI